MVKFTVYQKDLRTHTSFILTDYGEIFGRENFDMAKDWHKEGLLADLDAAIMDLLDKLQGLVGKARRSSQPIRLELE